MRAPIFALLAGLLLAGCASAGLQSSSAPQPAKPVAVERLYTGLWHEFARRPMALTDGCVLATTAYRRDAQGRIDVLDSCRMGTLAGELKTIGGPGEILDPGTNAKLRVTYTLFGVVPIVRDYWILDRAQDYSWFISADPSFTDLYIFVRDPKMSPALRRQLVQRAAALGYDVSKLEYPELPRR